MHSYLHRQSASDADNDGPPTMVKGHEKWRLADIYMVGDIDEVHPF